VTRRVEQSDTLVEGLRSLGADVIVVPAIEIAPPSDLGPLDRALRDLLTYHWLVFTSANAVSAVAVRMGLLGNAEALRPPLKVASVGPSTSRAFEKCFPGRLVDLEPSGDYHAAALAEAFVADGVANRRFLVPVADRASDRLAKQLRQHGALVTVVVAYRTLPAPDLATRLAQGVGVVDLICLASPSAAQAIAAAWPGPVTGLEVAVIGAETGAAARAVGMDVKVVAQPQTVAGLLSRIAEHFERRQTA
jgi:uroporphyrinogen III methyltransferase / synthase